MRLILASCTTLYLFIYYLYTVLFITYLQVKFDVDFNTMLPTIDKQNEFEQTILNEYANMWPDVHLRVGSIYEGMFKIHMRYFLKL